MRFSSKTFKRRSRKSKKTRKSRKSRKVRKQRGGGDTFSRAIPNAAVRTNSVPIDEEVKDPVTETD